MTDCSAGSIIQQAQCVLQPVADKLGQGAKYTWEVYYRQTIVSAITDLIVMSIVLVVAIIGVVIALKFLNAGKKKLREYKAAKAKGDYDVYDDGFDQFMVAGVISIPAIVTIIVILTMIPYQLQKLFNPGYFTIHEIITTFKGF